MIANIRVLLEVLKSLLEKMGPMSNNEFNTIALLDEDESSCEIYNIVILHV